jgi:hypothetical protein
MHTNLSGHRPAVTPAVESQNVSPYQRLAASMDAASRKQHSLRKANGQTCVSVSLKSPPIPGTLSHAGNRDLSDSPAWISGRLGPVSEVTKLVVNFPYATTRLFDGIGYHPSP